LNTIYCVEPTMIVARKRTKGVLSDMGVRYDELDEIATANPSLRGMIAGYVAETRCRDTWFSHDERVSRVTKWDDHDRTKKGDISFAYRGQDFSVEVKSVQTSSVDMVAGDLVGKYQCDASDRRMVSFSDGSGLETTSLLVGEFDMVAVCLMAMTGKWEFAFARNDALPRRSSSARVNPRLSELQMQELLMGTMNISYPLGAPYYDNPWDVLDDIIATR
jgi:hypothetical protein